MDDWFWRFPVHINVLEAQAVLRLLRRLAYDGGDLRVPLMVDSQVVRCCLTRGRSSAASLRGVMKKIASVALAFGLYIGAPLPLLASIQLTTLLVALACLHDVALSPKAYLLLLSPI